MLLRHIHCLYLYHSLFSGLSLLKSMIESISFRKELTCACLEVTAKAVKVLLSVLNAFLAPT